MYVHACGQVSHMCAACEVCVADRQTRTDTHADKADGDKRHPMEMHGSVPLDLDEAPALMEQDAEDHMTHRETQTRRRTDM